MFIVNTWKQYNVRDDDRNKGVENTKRLPFSYADSGRKYQRMRLDRKVGIRLRRTMNVMPRNLDGILKSDKEGILKILSLKMMRSNLHFRWTAATRIWIWWWLAVFEGQRRETKEEREVYVILRRYLKWSSRLWWGLESRQY